MSQPVRPLSVIAADIRAHWPKVNYAAESYLIALENLNSVNDYYGMDKGSHMVMYFLSNANTWRGEHARRIKAELKAMIK